mmetsp:Transcript_7778/g.12151  ORF Transcript_7778/g.12151 Transcript_7778/m.12151 type:complete len:177 (+) Transcript_7778:100-630(+)
MKIYYLSVLVIAAASIEGTQAWAPPSSRCNIRQKRIHHYRPRNGGNWEDDTKSSRNDNSVTDYIPPWRQPEAMINNTPEEFKQRGPTPFDPFAPSSTDNFRKPYGSTPQNNMPPPPPPPESDIRRIVGVENVLDDVIWAAVGMFATGEKAATCERQIATRNSDCIICIFDTFSINR